MAKALPLMIQGTHSDAGKSILVTALSRIFYQDGYKTAPFKSQNMALNSYITVDGKEIGRAQGVQAEAANVLATTDMNPILIKPSRENEAQIVVHGQPYENMQAKVYRSRFFPIGLKLIEEAYQRLAASYERIVIEGAGSPAEVNLNDKELVNMRVARLTNAPVILVGDIEKGGVFASLVGTLQLMEPEDRERVIGVIINKFRGDVSLLEPGLRWFEEYTGKPVLGVIPYILDLHIEAEDSVTLKRYTSSPNPDKELDIVVIRYPMISNFTDADPFFVEKDCHVRFVQKEEELGNPDLLILPGSKNTLEDLMFLKDSGLDQAIIELAEGKQTMIFGICGGYQMLGEKVEDPFQVESPHLELSGLGLLPTRTTMSKGKRTVRSEGRISYHQSSFSITGYEIHMGNTEVLPSDHVQPFIQLEQVEDSFIKEYDGLKTQNEQVIGTYFHGIFHNDPLRHEILNKLRREKGLAPVENRVHYYQLREESFDQLADTVRKHIRLDLIQEKMQTFSRKGVEALAKDRS